MNGIVSVRKTFALYYIVLLLVLVSWANPDSLPPIFLRLVFMGLVIVPLWLNKSAVFPQLFLTFVVISASSFAVSYMPVDGLYVSVVLLLTLIFIRPVHDKIKIPAAFIVFTFQVLFVEMFNYEVPSLSFKLLGIIMLSFILPQNKESSLKAITYSFILISLVLSLEFIIHGNDVTQTVNTIEGSMDRKGWTDPNYFCSVIGCGVVAAMIALTKWPDMKRNYKLGILFTILISLYTMLAAASRGLFIALVASIALLLLNAPIRHKQKTYIIIVAVVSAIVLYYCGAFDLLILRFKSDGGDLGGRTQIWEGRLNAFFADCNFFQRMFGVGRLNSQYLGTDKFLGSHNDYIAILTAYGYVGLILFLYILVHPIVKAKSNKTLVLSIAALLYLSIAMCSIEPFIGGQWACLYFYLYILTLSQSKNEAQV